MSRLQDAIIDRLNADIAEEIENLDRATDPIRKREIQSVIGALEDAKRNIAKIADEEREGLRRPQDMRDEIGDKIRFYGDEMRWYGMNDTLKDIHDFFYERARSAMSDKCSVETIQQIGNMLTVFDHAVYLYCEAKGMRIPAWAGG